MRQNRIHFQYVREGPFYCWLEVEIQAPHVTSTSKARGGRWPCGYLADMKVLVSYLALSDTTLVGSSGGLVTTCWRWKSRAFPAWVRIKQYVFGGVQLDKRGIVLEFFLLQNCIFLVLRIERRDFCCFFLFLSIPVSVSGFLVSSTSSLG